jgi:hypothetical protein
VPIREPSQNARRVADDAFASGAGIQQGGLLTVRRSQISRNAASASGSAGAAQGAGIWNRRVRPELPVVLTLADSVVTRNTLTASPGIDVEAGGAFTELPIALRNTVIAQNAADDCYGC